MDNRNFFQSGELLRILHFACCPITCSLYSHELKKWKIMPECKSVTARNSHTWPCCRQMSPAPSRINASLLLAVSQHPGQLFAKMPHYAYFGRSTRSLGRKLKYKIPGCRGTHSTRLSARRPSRPICKSLRLLNYTSRALRNAAA